MAEHTGPSPDGPSRSGPFGERDRRYHRHLAASRALGAIAALIALLALAGWVFGIEPLTRLHPDWVTMKFNTAIGILLLGVNLFLDGRCPRACHWSMSLGVAALGAVTLLEYLGLDLKIDQFVVQDRYSGTATGIPGRMAIPTAFSFVFLGIAAWMRAGSHVRVWQSMILVTLLFNFVGLLGYFYGAASLVTAIPIASSGVALNTSIALMLLSVATLLSRHDVGFMGVLTSPEAGGSLARRILPASILILVLLGVLLRVFEQKESAVAAIDMDLIVATGSLLMGWLIWRNARLLNAQDARSRELHRTVQEGERRLKLIIDSVPVLISYVNADRRYRFVNASYSRWFGVSEAAIVGRSLLEVLGPEAYANIRDKVDRALAGEIVSYEQEVPYGLGGTRYVLASYVPDRARDGSVRGFYAVISDISERRAAERALEKAREELERRVEERTREVELQGTIVRNMAEGACLITATDQLIVYANPKFEEIFGYAPGELTGRHVSVLNYVDPGEDPDRARGIAREIGGEILRRGTYSYHIRNRKKDGSPFWCRATSSVFDHPRYGRVFVVVHEDITERRRAEEELRRSEESFSMVISQATVGIFITDLEGRYVGINRAGYELLGYSSPDALLGKRIQDIIRREDRPRLEGDRARVLAGETITGDWRLLRADGSLVDAEVSTRLLPDGRWIAFVRDISERKRFEQSLQENARDLARSNAELEQFAYVASHDLREPLRIVTNFAELLERRYKGRLDEQAERYIGYIVEGVSRMQSLIGDLLSYSRVGRVGAEQEELEVRESVEEARKNLAAAIEESGAEIRVGTLPRLTASPGEMRQLFQNLLSNAIKFRRKGVAPKVEVSARKEGNLWVFSVKDNGIGIDPRYADRIFVIFQRLHGRGEYPGTGIGLAICKKIVERHGGSIWVKSVPGEGATFEFSLPEQAQAELRKASGQ